jgi:HEAT repeat protein
MSLLIVVVFLALMYCVVRPDSVRAAVEEIETILALKSDPKPASPAKFSEHLEEKLDAMTAQGQAELLLEESINHYAGAIEQISARVDGWRGTLQMTPKLENMLATAMDSNDLRVRAAALELYLAANNIAKAPTSVYTLEERVSQEPGARAWSLWMLGALGNRGVEPERVLREELNFIQDSSEETRFWAVEGLAHLGADAAINPLLDVLRSDPSPKVRERAACSLAQSGMFTREQRMSAVPKLLDLADDVALEPTTRTWVYQALRDITGAGLGPDPQAWRNWWNEHGH